MAVLTRTRTVIGFTDLSCDANADKMWRKREDFENRLNPALPTVHDSLNEKPFVQNTRFNDRERDDCPGRCYVDDPHEHAPGDGGLG